MARSAVLVSVVLSVLTSLSATPAAAQTAPAPEPTGSGTISGRVVDDAGASAAGACVTATPLDGGLTSASDAVDVDGQYALTVPPGQYVLRISSCSADGPYASAYRGGVDRAADSPAVTAAAGEVAPVDLQAAHAATVAGRVVHDDGAAAAGHCVRVYGSAAPEILPWTRVAEDGTYVVPGVAPGTRRVRFGSCDDIDSYGSWFSQARAYDEATVLDLAPGEARTGIDGTVPRYATLTGRVVDETGTPVVGACAQLQSASGGGFIGRSGCTDAEGRWRIENLRPSAYKVLITRGVQGPNDDLVERYYPGVPDSSAAVPVVVTEGAELPFIEVVMPHGARVSGRITSARDGTPLVGACVAARSLTGSTGGTGGLTDADGNYVIRGVDVGAYHVHARRCSAGNWAPRWRGASNDDRPADDGLLLQLGDSVSGIDVSLEPGAVITGRAVNTATEPLAGLCVTAYGGSSVQEDAQTDAEGRYTLQGLPTSSTYYVFWRDCRTGRYATEYTGGTAFAETATRLDLTAGTTTTLPDAVLRLAGGVTGTVTDARTGLRVGRVGVAVLDPATGFTAGYGFTDGNGLYAVRGIRPGAWKVRFYDGGANVAVPEYWDDSLTFPDAQEVAVLEGVDRPDVDAAVLLLTVPSVPRLPDLTPAPEGAQVTWQPPLDDGSAAIERYEVVTADGEVLAAADGQARQTRVSGLTAGQTYSMAVRAVNRKGPGPATEPLEVTPLAATGHEPAPPVTVERLAGTDRVTTAIAIARDSHPVAASSDMVVLSRADAFADALAGAPLAARNGAPLLLTGRDRLDERVRAEIRRVLRPGGLVALLGGTAALSQTVTAALVEDGFAVQRYAGATRYETAAQIASTGLGSPSTLLLANGADFPDALAGSAAAGRIGAAVLLTDGSRMPAATAAYLQRHPAARRFALGGPAAAADPAATRVVGRDRYDTAVQIARAVLPPATALAVASGVTFPDALAGSAHAARRGAVLLLTAPTALPSSVSTYLAEHRSGIDSATVYGGTSAVATGVAVELHQRLTP